MTKGGRTSPLVDWLAERDLLRGPFVFLDYWASVFGLEAVLPEDGPLTDRTLFRAGLDRPNLELPLRRLYFVLYFIGPALLFFRSLRRLGRYRFRFRSEVGRSVMGELDRFRLELDPVGGGRVDVHGAGRPLARSLLDPRLIAGFTGLLLATYKLVLASLLSIVAVGIAGPWLLLSGRVDAVLPFWIPVGFPVFVLLIYLVFRDVVTAVLGAIPIVAGRFLVGFLGTSGGWIPFGGGLFVLFLVYLAVDWLFVPRPLPPVLMLYHRDLEPGHYPREDDAPWWLEGRSYWVWRYMTLAPAELNKFWERDWERIEVWIRADGPEAGALEWVVTDAHYRELWIPFERLGS
ncbi:MAG: hypothetical protein R3266_09010, partial [Gemmatimonadota bacterium]|nr:hypothetical protein [Gemmatimonadota bacterium]